MLQDDKGSNYMLIPSYTCSNLCNILKTKKYLKSVHDEYSDSIPPQNYDWTICLLAKTVSKGRINEPFLHSFDGKYVF